MYIDEVKEYKLRTTLMPYPAEITLLGIALANSYAVETMLTSGCLIIADYWGYIARMAACPEAVTAIAITIGILAGSAAGIMPAPSVDSSSCADALPWIIAWIDDIEHNRLVKVETLQKHEGADLGLWQTRYPDTHSLSWVDFRGGGSIYPPELKHDASIVKTDQSAKEE